MRPGQGLNRFAYALNDPIGSLDPSGRDCAKSSGTIWDGKQISSGYDTCSVGIGDFFLGGFFHLQYAKDDKAERRRERRESRRQAGGNEEPSPGTNGSTTTVPPSPPNPPNPPNPPQPPSPPTGPQDCNTALGCNSNSQIAQQVVQTYDNDVELISKVWATSAALILPVAPTVLGATGGLTTLGGLGAAASGAGREILLVDGFYQAEGSAFKFSQYYYEKLWATGRPAPFLQAEEVLATARSVVADQMPGFYRYANEFIEMVYNPTTKEVWHLLPIH